jgi:metallo-beta-lactamase family protein
MELHFWGAAQTVTGSQHHVIWEGRNILLDCGLFQGKRAEAEWRNREFAISPSEVDAVLLSHAHTDHTGVLPLLVKKGFRGPIYATPATADMTDFMLLDSGHIQEADVAFINKQNQRRGKTERLQPLYTVADAEQAMQYFETVGYQQPFEPLPGLQVSYYEAGHILGSIFMVLEWQEGGRTRRLGFSGDLGRKNKPILRDPIQLDLALDALIIESTYGTTDHPDPEAGLAKLRDVINQTCDRTGKVIIPSFAVGRAQDLVYWIHQLMNANEIPRIPVYVDSPLTSNISQVFRKHKELYDAQTLGFIAQYQNDLLVFPELRFVESVEESKSINDYRGSAIIISASGMCETGRILHHLRNNISDSRNTVLMVSWQAPNTLGRRIVERQPYVNIFGESHKMEAQVAAINGMSAHAGKSELLAWLEPLKGRTGPIYLVHGESDIQAQFRETLLQVGHPLVHVPRRDDFFIV